MTTDDLACGQTGPTLRVPRLRTRHRRTHCLICRPTAQGKLENIAAAAADRPHTFPWCSVSRHQSLPIRRSIEIPILFAPRRDVHRPKMLSCKERMTMRRIPQDKHPRFTLTLQPSPILWCGHCPISKTRTHRNVVSREVSHTLPELVTWSGFPRSP